MLKVLKATVFIVSFDIDSLLVLYLHYEFIKCVELQLLAALIELHVATFFSQGQLLHIYTKFVSIGSNLVFNMGGDKSTVPFVSAA